LVKLLIKLSMLQSA